MDFIWLNSILALIGLLYVIFVDKLPNYLVIYDQPDNYRKIHSKPVPLIGGIILFLSISINIMVLYSNFDLSIKVSLISIVLFFGFFIIGFLDDKFILSPTRKTFLIIFLLLIILPLENDFIVRNLLFKNFEKNINLNEAGIFFTVLSLYFFYNFLNFSDGANGITVSLCIFWTLIFIFFGNLNQLFLIIILIWLLFVLIFNLSEKLFIGNSGSSFLSILFGSLFILNYNFDYSIKCDEILLLMFIPAVDSIRVIIERIFKGYSPFKPDKTHLHHFMFTSFNAKVVFIPYILFASLPYISSLYINNSFFIILTSLLIYIGTIFFLKKKLK